MNVIAGHSVAPIQGPRFYLPLNNRRAIPLGFQAMPMPNPFVGPGPG